jgi:hypothetical protein
MATTPNQLPSSSAAAVGATIFTTLGFVVMAAATWLSGKARQLKLMAN